MTVSRMRRLKTPTQMTKALWDELQDLLEVMPGWELEVRQSASGYHVAARYVAGTDDAELKAARMEPRTFGHSPSLPTLRHWLRAFVVGVRVGKWINRAR